MRNFASFNKHFYITLDEDIYVKGIILTNDIFVLFNLHLTADHMKEISHTRQYLKDVNT